MVPGGLCCNLPYEAFCTNDFLLISWSVAVLSVEIRPVMTTTGRRPPMLDDVICHCFQVWLVLLFLTYSNPNFQELAVVRTPV